MKKNFCIVFALLLCSGHVFADKPNIVYLLIDDMGYADCGFQGGKDIRTPMIDQLASQGTIIESLYVQPVCSPTRSTLMTGRYPTHTGVYSIVRPNAPWGLPLAEQMLPQALQGAGYTTAICGKWHLGEFETAYKPTQRGFDHQYGHFFGAIDYFTHKRGATVDWYRDDKPLAEEGYSTHLVAKEAVKLIRQQPADKPLFLYVPFNGIHAPHQVPASYKELYAALPEPRRSIAGMLAAVDEAIGQITKAIEEKGLTKNTIILFHSDNGGPGPGKATMNTPLRAGKGTIYEGGVRTKGFIKWPDKIAAGATIKEPMHTVDWYPTLTKLVGAKVDQKLPLDGMDVWPMLTSNAKSPHEAILLHGTTPGNAAIRMGDWKLLLNASEVDAEEATDVAKMSGKMELYNLTEDVSEKNNLAAEKPEKVKELRAKLNEMLKDAVPAGGGKAAKKKAA